MNLQNNRFWCCAPNLYCMKCVPLFDSVDGVKILFDFMEWLVYTYSTVCFSGTLVILCYVHVLTFNMFPTSWLPSMHHTMYYPNPFLFWLFAIPLCIPHPPHLFPHPSCSCPFPAYWEFVICRPYSPPYGPLMFLRCLSIFVLAFDAKAVSQWLSALQIC